MPFPSVVCLGALQIENTCKEDAGEYTCISQSDESTGASLTQTIMLMVAGAPGQINGKVELSANSAVMMTMWIVLSEIMCMCVIAWALLHPWGGFPMCSCPGQANFF